MRNILILLSLFFIVGCNFNIRETNHLGDNCLLVVDYSKILCLDGVADTNNTYVFIDRNRFENEDSKFSSLRVYTMMVVDIEKNGVHIWVTLSNSSHSIRVLFNEAPRLESMYNVICKEKSLDESVLLKSDGTIVVSPEPVEVESVTEDEISMEP